jgi:chitinase
MPTKNLRWSASYLLLALGVTAASFTPLACSGGGGAGGGTGGATAGAGGAGMGGAAGGTGGVAGGTGTAGQWVMGYYVGYDLNAYPIASIDWAGLTHIVFSPLTLNDDLSLNLSFSDQNGTGQQDAMAVAQAAHAHGVKALLMLGGAGAGANIAAAAGAGQRASFVAALTGAMTTLGYDGIDLDWEDSVDLDDLVALAQALRAAKPNILLSYPAGAINGNFQSVDPRLATLAASLDRFNVQTYYPSTAVAGQGWDSWFSSPLGGVSGTTPIAIDDTLQRYAAAGIPKSKLGMGIAFYAICYTGGITGPRQPTNGTTQQIVGGDNQYPLRAFYAPGGTFDASDGANRIRDASAAEPYLTFASPVSDGPCGAATQYIAYEDETSIAAKGAFSRANGYGGIIIWTIEEGWLPAGAAGGRAPNELMQALKTAFIDP